MKIGQAECVQLRVCLSIDGQELRGRGRGTMTQSPVRFLSVISAGAAICVVLHETDIVFGERCPYQVIQRWMWGQPAILL